VIATSLEQEGDLRPGEWGLFRLVSDSIRALPAHPRFDKVTCHDMADAVSRIWPGQLTAVAGHCVRSTWDHGWVEYTHRMDTRQRLVIDVYPWAASGGPMLYLLDYRTPWHGLFIPAPRYPVVDAERVKLLCERLAERPL
jgi:hypothetical protein